VLELYLVHLVPIAIPHRDEDFEADVHVDFHLVLLGVLDIARLWGCSVADLVDI
jgi:hypothetical protein